MSERDPEAALRIRVLRLDAVAQGIATGLIAGLVLFVATNWLVVKGGEVVGPHLRLLGIVLVGYEVTFRGSLVGLAYGFVVGFAAAFLVSALYNRIAVGKDGGRVRARR